MKKLYVVAIFLLILVLIGTTACNPGKEANQRLAEVVRGDLTTTVNGIGNITISQERMLFFSTDGRVGEVYVNEGDKVSKGDVLAKLDIAPLELAVIRAQVALAQAQIARTQAQVQADLTQAQATRIQAQIDLNTTEENPS